MCLLRSLINLLSKLKSNSSPPFHFPTRSSASYVILVLINFTEFLSNGPAMEGGRLAPIQAHRSPQIIRIDIRKPGPSEISAIPADLFARWAQVNQPGPGELSISDGRAACGEMWRSWARAPQPSQVRCLDGKRHQIHGHHRYLCPVCRTLGFVRDLLTFRAGWRYMNKGNTQAI